MIGWLVGRLGAPLLAQVALGLAVALLLSSLALAGMTHAYLGKRDELATARADLGAAQDANASNVTTIGDLRTANAEWVKACGPDPETARAVIASLQRGETAARGEATRLRRELRSLAHADPTVDAYLRAGVPGVVVDRLRDAAPGS